MLNDKDLHRCRVCGHLEPEYPWGESGTVASFDICDCCGVTFGYEDIQYSAIIAARERWLAGGALWFRESKKPVEWNLGNQLDSIPEPFR